MQLVSTLFDLSSNLNTSIPVYVWQRCAKALFEIMDLLAEHQHIVLDDTLEGAPERVGEPPATEVFTVWGNIRAFVERLDDELFKILQVRVWCTSHPESPCELYGLACTLGGEICAGPQPRVCGAP